MIKQDRSRVSTPDSLDPNGVKCRDELDKNRKAVLQHRRRDWDDVKGYLKFDAYAANPDVKRQLSRLFFNKCAYCEVSLGIQDLHTEHYRPKKAVDAQDNKDKRGYWWLGADWENLLPACNHCNRSPGTDHATGTESDSGKKTRFPLLAATKHARTRHGLGREKPVLLDPTIDEPSAYFTFGQGKKRWFAYAMHASGSDDYIRANETIKIIGLNRIGLVRHRTEYLQSVSHASRIYAEAAAEYNLAVKGKQPQEEIDRLQRAAAKAWPEVERYLTSPRLQHLHATVRCIEAELARFGLSLRTLVGSAKLPIPASSLK